MTERIPRPGRTGGAGRGRDAMKIQMRFTLAATVEEVVLRLSRAMRGTELRLVRLVGDGELVYPLRVRSGTWKATRWEAFLGPRPGRPLHGEDVERCLRQLDDHLPRRASVGLGDPPRPAEPREG